ncbi:glycosyltransferase family 2 protein [Cellulophaga omnivescoria]|uniref:glycosyltransferase family 2 protein n=1 Tax=Cellulophaga omnivescoria TaxID=1888890 RepID=UPI00098421A1|nr:glycosyltransferase family 2 protein [Cellulophaga omnivescoria]WBU90702.1 glycosyltransferase family 2 protein [Cellulophaga omnivescoria]
MNNKVSIVTPVYNSEKFVSDCIQSVQDQTYENWEHILVDDCSSDLSASIIKEFAKTDSRVIYVKLKKNSGAGVSRNKAIELASGSYIAFLDSDDIWHKDKLGRQIEFMVKNKHNFSFSSYDVIDEKGNVLSKSKKVLNHVNYNRALFKNPIGCLTVIYNCDSLGKHYMPSIRKRQDYALWLKLLKITDAYGLNLNLASYRIVNNSISSNKLDLLKYEWKIYREEEKLSFIKSSFYLFTAVVLKLKSYFC